MLAKRIIPCLDVNNGRVVKGVHFVNLQDAGDPVDCAKTYDKNGADELVFLDITASSDNRDAIYDIIKKTAGEVFMPVTVGGGIRNNEDIRKMLLCGADKVSLNTSIVKNPDIISKASEKFGSQCVVAAIDAKRDAESSSKKWNVYTHGGRERTDIDVVNWAKECESRGAGEILLTSMDQDGTKQGYDLDLLKAVISSVNIPVIASGGAGNYDHFYEALHDASSSAVLAASLFHFGEMTISQLKSYLHKKGVCVRCQ